MHFQRFKEDGRCWFAYIYPFVYLRAPIFTYRQILLFFIVLYFLSVVLIWAAWKKYWDVSERRKKDHMLQWIFHMQIMFFYKFFVECLLSEEEIFYKAW